MEQPKPLPPIARSISTTSQENGRTVTVVLTHQLVHLLSEQLYQSPLKAIEELVVNAYDANAKICRIFVPLPTDTEHEFIAVYDDGHGMDYIGLTDLWQVGRSKKREEEYERRSERKQIGKFGIGKLATSTIARQLTYISKSPEGILGVTIDFTIFQAPSVQEQEERVVKEEKSSDETKFYSHTLPIQPIHLPVYKIETWPDFIDESYLKSVLEALGLEAIDPNAESWTLAILENLKEKAQEIDSGPLKWVLRTAMPLGTNFRLFLNTEEILSSKLDYDRIVEFDITELSSERLQGLSKDTGEEWSVDGNYIKSQSFPTGIEGYVFITERTLYGLKSDDIQRSYGFFVKVRNRLVNLVDPLFGMEPVRHGILNRFYGEIQADDLDKYLTASRDTVEESSIKEKFRKFLREVINEADRRYEKAVKEKKEEEEEGRHKEGQKELVAPRLVEEPVADALLIQRYDLKGAEANDEWFYLDLPDQTDINELVQQLYTTPRSKYQYHYMNMGRANRLVNFDPTSSAFYINTEHEFAKEYVSDSSSRRLLEDFVTTEMLLEIFLRERHISPELIGEVLQVRDNLFRSLAQDRSFSFTMIAQWLRDAASDKYELEINLVVAARALGFNANHISNSNEPDGLARYRGYPGGVKKLVLEAKSSKYDVKRPGDMDFAALRRHTDKYKADGCLLVAPGYVGQDKNDSKVSEIARQQKISCWTVEQLAEVVEKAESRHIGAREILNIVTSHFAPLEVTRAIDQLLTQPDWSNQDLYQVIIEVLREMEGSGIDEPRSIDMIKGAIMINPEFKTIRANEIHQAFFNLAGASKGTLIVNRDSGEFHVTADIDELERRVSDLTKSPINGRRISSFRS
jgi:hypothetical protein